MTNIIFGTLKINSDCLSEHYQNVEDVASEFRDACQAQVIVKDETIVFSIINDYDTAIDARERFFDILKNIGNDAILDLKASCVNSLTHDNTIQYMYDPIAKEFIMRQHYGTSFGDDGDPEWSAWDIMDN